MLVVVLVTLIGDDVPRGSAPAVGIGLGVLMVALAIGATMLFNRKRHSILGLRSREDAVLELEAKGLLEALCFHATRAFQVEELEDEGSHYFIELGDGSVLFLTGQYLYEYESGDTGDDSEQSGRRLFPCTEFTVRTHKVKGYTVDLVCAGTVLEPEVVTPPFTENDYREERIPKDRTIIRDRTYDELKLERLGTG